MLSKVQQINLKNNGKFTIGYLTALSHSRESDMEYTIKVKGKFYESTGYSEDKKKRKIGGRFFVVFNKNRPKNSELFVNLPVPDSIQKAPPW